MQANYCLLFGHTWMFAMLLTFHTCSYCRSVSYLCVCSPIQTSFCRAVVGLYACRHTELFWQIQTLLYCFPECDRTKIDLLSLHWTDKLCSLFQLSRLSRFSAVAQIVIINCVRILHVAPLCSLTKYAYVKWPPHCTPLHTSLAESYASCLFGISSCSSPTRRPTLAAETQLFQWNETCWSYFATAQPFCGKTQETHLEYECHYLSKCILNNGMYLAFWKHKLILMAKQNKYFF